MVFDSSSQSPVSREESDLELLMEDLAGEMSEGTVGKLKVEGSREDPRELDEALRESSILRLNGISNRELNPQGNRRKQATGMSVRCHCNLATCVTNNYMCKSERRVHEDGTWSDAGCFVEEIEGQSDGISGQHGVAEWNGRVATARRGCIDMLSREKQRLCSDRTGAPVHCCTQDMCNYPKSFYPSNFQNPSNNGRIPTFDSSGSLRGLGSMNPGNNMPNLDQQVWLRAAVIAVPICGLMILVVLIIVARKLLRNEDDYKNYPEPHPIMRRKSPSTAGTSMRSVIHSQQVQAAGQGLQPVFLQPPAYPREYHCCCKEEALVNNAETYSASDASSLIFPFRKGSPVEGSGETEELVENRHHSHCPANPSHISSDFDEESLTDQGYFRPPSIVLNPDPAMAPKTNKFNILSKLGIGKDSPANSPFQV